MIIRYFLSQNQRIIMPQNRDGPPAVRVYTVCDESKYLIVRNVPSLGCGDELLKLFGSYGDIEECKPMDAEDCEPFTEVYWIKFRLVNNARFAKRKLDEFVFFGNRLQVSYAPHYENLADTKEKLEVRQQDILGRLNPGRSRGTTSVHKPSTLNASLSVASPPLSELGNFHRRTSGELQHISGHKSSSLTRVTSDEDYFPSDSMNETVRLVREKLREIQSNPETVEAGPSKKTRLDNRRRI